MHWALYPGSGHPSNASIRQSFSLRSPSLASHKPQMEGILLSVYVPMHTPFLRSQSALSCGSLCTCWHSKNSAAAPRSVYRWSSAAQQPVKELSVGKRRSFSGWEWLFFALLEVAGHFCEIGLHPLLECSQRNLEPNPRLPDLTALTHVT